MRYARAIVLGAIVGAVVIDLYLVVVQIALHHRPVGFTTMRVSQWDASNVLGDAAWTGEWGSAALGFGMHLVVCLVWATVMTLLMVRSPALLRQPGIVGLVFGTIVMVVMRYLVVPIGHALWPPTDLLHNTLTYIGHTVFFGIPLALVVSKTLSQKHLDQRAYA